MSTGERNHKYIWASQVNPLDETEPYNLKEGSLETLAKQVMVILEKIDMRHGEVARLVFFDALLQTINCASTSMAEGVFSGVDLEAKEDLIGIAESGGRLAIAIIKSLGLELLSASQAAAVLSELKTRLLVG